MKIQTIPQTPTTLCTTCEHGLVYERQTGALAGFCTFGSMMPVPLDIVRCSDYEHKQRVSKYDMEKIAWTIRHDKSGAIRGFEPPPKKIDGR